MMLTTMAMPRMRARLATATAVVLATVVPPQPDVTTSDCPQRGMPCTSMQPTDGTLQKPQPLGALVQLAQPDRPEQEPGEE